MVRFHTHSKYYCPKISAIQLKMWILDELFAEDFIKQQKVFNWNYIHKIREEINKNGKLDETHIWSIIVFQYWWKKYMN